MGGAFDNSAWRYYWHEPTGTGRNVFCIFERRIHLTSSPETAEIFLFVDSLYRLIVNGTICGYGPARFLPSHPEYDSYDIAGCLRVGENSIRIEANARGAPSYQAVPSIGGVAVKGLVDGRIPLDLPEGWTVRRSRAWDPDSEHYSFAQGPVEICDTGELHREKDGCLVPVAVEKHLHWGTPSARKIRRPSFRLETPGRVIRCSELKNGFFRVGFRCPANEGGRQPFFTYIYSPAVQEVEAGVFWGPIGLRGRWLEHQTCPVRGNRETVCFQLQAGWNFLFGLPEMLKPSWVWQMELPSDRGLQVRSLPGTANQAAFCIGPVISGHDIPSTPPACAEELPGYPSSWPPAGNFRRPPSPAREMAWDLPGRDLLPPDSPWERAVHFPGGVDSTIVLDMGSEYLGHAFAEVDAPRGTVLDIGHDERLGENGMPDYFRCNPFLNSTDRFVLHGGCQRIETFHERGGRYLQLTFRDAMGPVTLESAGIRSSCGDYPRSGRFSCGDPDLDWAWEAGDRTLRSSMADGWIDPWRERGLYLGDALVQGHATRKITSDWRLDPWCLRLWGRAQFSNGQLPDVVPSHHETPLCDYTLIWIIALRNYWAASGDTGLVVELWHVIKNIFSSPVWTSGERGLWVVTPETKVFIDWGVVPEERLGVNAALNAYRYRALECASEMAGAIGLHAEAEACRREAISVGKAFRDVFWDPGLGRFAASKIEGKIFAGPALHANALALAFGLSDDVSTTPAADYLASGLRIASGFPAGHCEIYFLYFALDGFYRSGRAADAENAMREYYGFMRNRGARTLWETLLAGASGRDSLCHGWSSGAIPHLAERVLGVRPVNAGDPSRILIAPEAETLDHAEGIVPHPSGPISVRWAVEESLLRIEGRGPEGVEIIIRPQGRLAGLNRAEFEESSCVYSGEAVGAVSARYSTA